MVVIDVVILKVKFLSKLLIKIIKTFIKKQKKKNGYFKIIF